MTFPCTKSFILFALVGTGTLLAETRPEDLIVFPAVLPEAPHVYDAKSGPVVRWDKRENPRQAGVTLIRPEKSVFKKPEATMAYDADGATLLIHVTDDAEVMAPATRMGQEALMSGGMPTIPGIPVMKQEKIKVKPKHLETLSVDGYITHREPTDPLLVMIVPDGKTGKDRFVIRFDWLSARADRAPQMAEWLHKAADTLDLAKLQSLP